MNVGQLRSALSTLPDDMPVVYNYDTGHSFPLLNDAYTATLAEYFHRTTERVPVLILDTEAPQSGDQQDGLYELKDILIGGTGE